MRPMKPYSQDLRVRIVKAVDDGMSKSGTARLFGMSLSSVKRYMRIAQRGESLTPRKGRWQAAQGGSESIRELLEEDVTERPAATVKERRHFLEHATGRALSDSTVGRLLKRMGFSQKTERGGGGARRVAESGLEGDGRPEGGAGAVRLC